MTPDQRSAVIDEAISWIGTPYHHRAAIKRVGVDCGQLAIAVYAGAGIVQWFDTGDYPPDWHLSRNEERYLQLVAQHADEVAEIEAGDLVVMQYGRTFSHGAIYIGSGLIVHAYVGRPVEKAALADFDRPMKFFRVRT
jgi:cell wall-associated NlpC family hydrolase